jgi:hypothetical protein
MTGGLREQLIGAWKLVSYVAHPVDGSAPFFPLGDSPSGIILYTPDGFMSAQLMSNGRAPFASGDWFEATLEEYRAEASTYIAYSGRFHLDEEKKALTHSMFVSLFPNWIGQTQSRLVRIEGDALYLSTETPTRSAGRVAISKLAWRRAT